MNEASRVYPSILKHTLDEDHNGHEDLAGFRIDSKGNRIKMNNDNNHRYHEHTAQHYHR